MAEKAKSKTFEDTLKALEKVVAELESGELPLEAQLKAFEKGVGYSRECLERLNAVEQKISLLVENPDGSLSKNPLEGSV